MNGTNFQVYVETAVPGTYSLVGSQKASATLNQNTDPIDVSTKDDRGGVFIPGRYTATLDLNSLYVPADPAYVLLLAAMRDGTNIKVEFTEDGGSTQTENIDAVVTSISLDFPDQDAAMCAVSFQLSGAWAAAV